MQKERLLQIGKWLGRWGEAIYGTRILAPFNTKAIDYVQSKDGRFAYAIVKEPAAEWASAPGVGPYTAAALASVLNGERVPVVDGNVARAFARVWALDDDFHKLPARTRSCPFPASSRPPACRSRSSAR